MHSLKTLAAILASVGLALACEPTRPPGGTPEEEEGAGGAGGGTAAASLAIEVVGLPDELSAPIVFTDLQGKEYKLWGAAKFDSLIPGTYGIRAPAAIPSRKTYYLTSFRSTELELAPGEDLVVEIAYEPLPYSLHLDSLTVPWRGQAELSGRILREPGFDEPLDLTVEQLHGAFSASPARFTLPATESEFRVKVENTGPLHSVEPSFGLTLVVHHEGRSFGFRQSFDARVIVTSDADAGPGTLREHLDHADEIPHPRRLHFADHIRTIRLRSPLRYDADDPLEIRGHAFPLPLMLPTPDANNSPSLWVDAEETGRALEVRGRLRLRNLGFSRGVAHRGGCILNEGSLELEGGVWLTACRAEAGGAIANAAGASLTITGSRLHWNEAEAGGAIVLEREGSARISKSVLLRNQARRGGAVRSHGALELEENTFWQNEAEDGGAVESHGPLREVGGHYGQNRSRWACGALSQLSPDEATVEAARFTENHAADGGALCAGTGASITIRDTSFEDNRAAFGGALLADHASLAVEGSAFLRNIGSEGGGAIAATPEASLRIETSRFRGNEGEKGGAVFAERAEVFRSTFLENRADEGGAIYASDLHLENDSLAFNEAREAGGALSLHGGWVDLRFATLVENQAARGGGLHASGGNVSLGASIVASSEGGDLHLDLVDDDDFYSEGFNLLGVAGPALEARLVGSDRYGRPGAPLDPGLAAISATELPSFPLLPESPAVDAVPESYCQKLLTGPGVDQQGARRPLGEACDAGAVEAY